MNKTVLILVVILVAASAGYWFMSRTTEAPAEFSTQNEKEMESLSEIPVSSSATMEPGRYEVDSESSVINFAAGKPAIAGYVHRGAFTLQSGNITLDDSSLTGEFVIDINSLKITSLGGGKVGQESALESHLKGEGFFDAETYNTATFTITDVTPKVLPGPDHSDYTATGNLTLKGQTNEVQFPMKVVVNENDEVWATANLEIDRTKWGISQGSASIAEKITDNIIGDIVSLELSVKLEN